MEHTFKVIVEVSYGPTIEHRFQTLRQALDWVSSNIEGWECSGLRRIHIVEKYDIVLTYVHDYSHQNWSKHERLIWRT